MAWVDKNDQILGSIRTNKKDVVHGLKFVNRLLKGLHVILSHAFSLVVCPITKKTFICVFTRSDVTVSSNSLDTIFLT